MSTIELSVSRKESETLLDSREQEYLDKRIKKAYQNNDRAASRAAHRAKIKHMNGVKEGYDAVNVEADGDESESDTAYEMSKRHILLEDSHKVDTGEFIKSIIFGGLDGIITLFAIVASISGSHLDVETGIFDLYLFPFD